MNTFRLIATIALVCGLLLTSRVPDLFAQCGPNEVLIGEDEDNYYCEDKDKVEQPNNPAQSNSSNVANWSGNWDTKEKGLAHSALRGLKDERLKNWISVNVQFNRFKDNNFSPLTAFDSTLRFKDDFFSGVTTDPRRENLIAFEAGKVFWIGMKDRPVEGFRSLEAWFIHSVSGSSAIFDMKEAKHRNDGFSSLGDIDTASQFAYIFRAQALRLSKPKGQKAQQEWNRVIREFQTHIDRFMPNK
jgi:hypothetical protein